MTKPTNVLKLSGAFLNHPEREKLRAAEPKPKKPIRTTPDKALDAAARKWYKIFISRMPPGVAFESDQTSLEDMAMLQAQFRAEPETFPTSRYQALMALRAKFGLTPVDRVKVQAEPEKPKNEFDDI
jgi:hypothetical protein